MNSRKRTGTVLAALLISLLLLAGTALSAFAAVKPMTDEEKAAYQANVESFLGDIFNYDDATLDQVREQGGFYEVLVDAIRDNREEIGAFKEAGPVEIDDSGDQVAATSNVTFEKYDVETIVYFDYDEGTRSYTPMNFVMNVDYPLSTRMAQAGQNTITGLLVVFVVLFFLAFVISLFKFVSPEARKKKAAEADDNQISMANAAAAGRLAKRKAMNAAAASAQTADEEDEIAAVIAAAIAAAEADMPSAEGYYVRSIRRRATGRNWKRA